MNLNQEFSFRPMAQAPIALIDNYTGISIQNCVPFPTTDSQ
jgi:hypothetical protein